MESKMNKSGSETNTAFGFENSGPDSMRTNGGFILSKVLRTELKALAAAANPDGGRLVRWTDLLERGVSKLTAEDLIALRSMRSAHASQRSDVRA